MKRIISLGLICVVLVLSLAPAAYAVDVDSPKFIEVLDICLPSEADNTKVYIRADGVMRSVFNIREAWHMEYVDMLFTIPSGRKITGVKVSSGSDPSTATELTFVNVSGDLYRAYGHIDFHGRTFYVWMDGTANWINWESLRIATFSLEGFDENATCDIQAYEYSDTINYRPTDLINYRFFEGSNEPDLNMLHLYIMCDNWRKYDFLDFVFSADINAINSITVTLNSTNVPFEVSYTDNGGMIQNHFIVSVRLDLRDLDRTSTEGLIVHVYGQVNSGSTNFISMDGCRGFVFGADFDAEMAWYKRIYYFLYNDFYFNIRSILESSGGTLSRIEDFLYQSSSAADDFKVESSDMISNLDDISASMDSVQRPVMDNINANFSGDISDASVLMAGLFTEVTKIPWLSTIILASCTLGLISYILYGKE